MAKKEEKKAKTEYTPSNRRVRALTKHIRIAPRKMRVVLGTIRKKMAMDSVGILSLLKQKGARFALKTLKSAIANAKNLGLDEKRLYVTEAKADGGPVFKRFLTRSMGRADRLLKRTTHLTIVVCEGNKIWGGRVSDEAKTKNKKKVAAAA